MKRLSKYGRTAVLVLVAVLAVQAGISLLVRTHRMQEYLVAHLQRAFGRPVQVGRFSVQVLPLPEFDVDAVTIGEDPAFGNEYFLRADRMTARLRWLGLFRGHFEFGTMSFTRPSLILVRNWEGRWNLERWLPPARLASVQGSIPVAPQVREESTYRLRKIDFDEGRINFKIGNEKGPFAFTDVSGSVEQVSPGRWQVQLEAQPWRSGVLLQSAGVLQVSGYVAGTSARLQPAQIRVHWEKVSLADLFRMATGNDSGVRGKFALDGNASVGMGWPAEGATAGTWRFTLQARATQIHRWDLTERDDNPRVNVNVKGLWELAAAEARAEELVVELPRSRLTGSGALQTSGSANWRAQFQDMDVQGDDILAWCRAFQPYVAEEAKLSSQITGSVSASGWPLRWESGSLESTAGSLRLPGKTVARLDPFHTSVRNGRIEVAGFRLRVPTEVAMKSTTERGEKGSKTRPNAGVEDTIEAALIQDSVGHEGSLHLNLHVPNVVPVFSLAASFGRPLNQGWEYQGSASGTLAWNWGAGGKELRRNGSLELTKAQLQVAGLNEPLKVEDARVEWRDGIRSASLGKVDAFGASWSGTIAESAENLGGEPSLWHFQLHADHLDATELDRWMGPRSRPNWLQRLLSSMLSSTDTARASELLRRVSAEGELTADTLTIEKIKLAKAHANLVIHSLHLDVSNADAQWAGGTVHGGMRAVFSPHPKYEVTATVDNVNMAQFPWTSRWAERWSGLASGTIHLTTAGVGRDELLQQLAGAGNVRLSKIEFRGWDVEQSTESGGPFAGASHWTSGGGEFQLADQKVSLDGFRLDGTHQRTQLSGTISFGMDGNLIFAPRARAATATQISQARTLHVSGQLENPDVAVLPLGSEQARP
jgi:AsmA family